VKKGNGRVLGKINNMKTVFEDDVCWDPVQNKQYEDPRKNSEKKLSNNDFESSKKGVQHEDFPGGHPS
jgi:hypothetical protein